MRVWTKVVKPSRYIKIDLSLLRQDKTCEVSTKARKADFIRRFQSAAMQRCMTAMFAQTPNSVTAQGFWGRHDNCKCSIFYETRKGVQRLGGSTKKWEPLEDAGARSAASGYLVFAGAGEKFAGSCIDKCRRKW